MPKNFETTDCHDVKELLELLSPLVADGFPPDRFIFRGQPDADFELEPSAHRIKGELTAPNQTGKKDVDVTTQIEFEARVLTQFLEGCDAAGLAVPGDGLMVRNILADLKIYRERPWQWPDPNLHQVQAAAQHYGVPTSLLDWSRRSYVAAYFAASSALREKVLNGRLAIWALNISQESQWKQLQLVKLPSGNNTNLAAQAGLFTVSPTTYIDADPSYFLPISLGYVDGLSLHRFTLPKTLAAQLLGACQLLGVSGATLFPGYVGVAQQVRDWALVNYKGYDPDEIAMRDLW